MKQRRAFSMPALSIRPLVWGCLTGLLTWATIQGIPWADVWRAMRHAHLGWLVLALLSVLLNNGAKVWRWRALLGEEGPRLGWGILATGHLVGQLVNTFVPGRVGEIGRLYLVNSEQRGRAFVLGTIVLEKTIDLIAFGLIFGLSLVLAPLPTQFAPPSIQAFVIALVLGLGLAGAVIAHEPLARFVVWLVKMVPVRGRQWIASRLLAMLDSLQALRESRHAWQILLATVIVWFTMVLNNYAVLRALYLPFGFDAALITMLVLLVGTSILTVPGRIGVFEYLAMVGLGFFGAETVQGVTFGVLLHAVVILPPTIGALLLLAWYEAGQQKRVHAS